MEDIYRAIGYYTARDQIQDSSRSLAKDMAEVLPDYAKTFIAKHPVLCFFATVAAAVVASQCVPKGSSSETKRLAQTGPISFGTQLRKEVK